MSLLSITESSLEEMCDSTTEIKLNYIIRSYLIRSDQNQHPTLIYII